MKMKGEIVEDLQKEYTIEGLPTSEVIHGDMYYGS